MSELVAETLHRPLQVGLEAVAEAAHSPGTAYREFRNWAATQGLCGHDGGYFPDWQQGIYVSTSITSGGLARQPDIGPAEAVAQNTDLASRLVDQLVADNGIDPRNILLSTDLPYVKGWGQADYLLFWIANMAGVPRDRYVGDDLIDFDANSEPARALNESKASAEERWPHYVDLVMLFDGLCQEIRLYRWNDYYEQCAPPGQVIQLVDASTSLGARAEALYATLHRMQVLEIMVREDKIEDRELVHSLGTLATVGGRIGTLDQAKGISVIARPHLRT
jgi:hypothetical protein